MGYMQSFNRRLKQVRESLSLSRQEVAELCGVEQDRVAGWESSDPARRSYPGVEELMAFCLKTGTSLDNLLDLDDLADNSQLELPGLAFSNGDDLAAAVHQLEKELERVQLSGEEAELLRRFRKSSVENRRMVTQILGK